MDLMALEDEPAPNAGQELAVHVLGRRGEATEVRPAAVEPLHRTYFRDGQVGGGVCPLRGLRGLAVGLATQHVGARSTPLGSGDKAQLLRGRASSPGNSAPRRRDEVVPHLRRVPLGFRKGLWGSGRAGGDVTRGCSQPGGSHHKALVPPL